MEDPPRDGATAPTRAIARSALGLAAIHRAQDGLLADMQAVGDAIYAEAP